MKNLLIIDPYSLDDKDCPIFVQSGDMRSFFSWGIRRRIKSNFNHSMVLWKNGTLVSQGSTYKEIGIDEYMNPGQIMKFWICEDITDEERAAILFKIKHELYQKWYKRMYDWPGIIGALFGLRWFNIPMLNYCSERVSNKVRCILPNIGKHPNPEDIDQLFKQSPRMKVLGYYFKA